MKTVCTRCKNTIIYENELPKKCPFCGADYLFPEKTESQKIGDANRLHLPDKLKNISPKSKKRIPMRILAFLIDIAWIFAGVFMSFKFYMFPQFMIKYTPWLGLILTLFAILRFIYRAVMGMRLKRAIKKGTTSVDELITILALKTRSDVLVLFKKAVKWGFLIGYGVKDGTKIYKSDDK